MKLLSHFLIIQMLFLSGCQGIFSSSGNSISIYKSPALMFWFNRPEECAATQNLILVPASDPLSAEIALTFGQIPQPSSLPAYQVGSGGIAIVTNGDGMDNLDAAALAQFFTGTAPQPMDVWVYPEDEDIQTTFNSSFLQGLKSSPNTRLALTTERMLQALLAPTPALGVLPTSMVPESLAILHTIQAVPILATSPQAPAGALAVLYQCLQK